MDECEWSYDDDSYSWDSECGEKFCFTDDGPKENGFKFCHGCGKRIEIKEAGNAAAETD